MTTLLTGEREFVPDEELAAVLSIPLTEVQTLSEQLAAEHRAAQELPRIQQAIHTRLQGGSQTVTDADLMTDTGLPLLVIRLALRPEIAGGTLHPRSPA